MPAIERAEAIQAATQEVVQGQSLAREDLQRVLRDQFTKAEQLIARVEAMNPEQIRDLAAQMRDNPAALSANHPRRQGTIRIPGVNAVGKEEALEPQLKTVRAPGLRGLLGQTDRTVQERQARVAAVALETYAETRARGAATVEWGAEALALPRDTPAADVLAAAATRAAEERRAHSATVVEWKSLAPPPTPAQIARRMQGLDPALREQAMERIPGLKPVVAAQTVAEQTRAPERVLARAGISR